MFPKRVRKVFPSRVRKVFPMLRVGFYHSHFSEKQTRLAFDGNISVEGCLRILPQRASLFKNMVSLEQILGFSSSLR